MVPDADVDDESQVVRRKRRRTVVEEIPSRSIPRCLQDPYAEKMFSEHSYIYPPSPSHNATNSPLSPPPQSNAHDPSLLVSHPFHSGHSLSDTCMMPIACEGLPPQSPDLQDVTVSDLEGEEERECESLVTPKGIPACAPVPTPASGLTLSLPEASDTIDAQRSVSRSEHSQSSASSSFDSFPAEPDVSDTAELSSDSSRLAAPDGDITRIE